MNGRKLWRTPVLKAMTYRATAPRHGAQEPHGRCATSWGAATGEVKDVIDADDRDFLQALGLIAVTLFVVALLVGLALGS